MESSTDIMLQELVDKCPVRTVPLDEQRIVSDMWKACMALNVSVAVGVALPHGFYGLYNGRDRRISLAGMSGPVFLHEVAHAIDHATGGMGAWPNSPFESFTQMFEAEIMAETVTHMVSRTVGVEAIMPFSSFLPGVNREDYPNHRVSYAVSDRCMRVYMRIMDVIDGTNTAADVERVLAS